MQQCREQRQVIRHQLRRHRVVDRAQEHAELPFLRCRLHLQHIVDGAVALSRRRALFHVPTLEVTGGHQHALQRAQAEVVVRLRRQLIVAQAEQEHGLSGKALGGVEALREQHDLGDQVPVRLDHGDAAEQLLQVVRQL